MNNINISQNLRKMQKHFACQLEYVLHKKNLSDRFLAYFISNVLTIRKLMAMLLHKICKLDQCDTFIILWMLFVRQMPQL